MIAIIDIGGTSIKYGVINSETEKYKLLGELDTNTSEKHFRIENRIDETMTKILDVYEVSGIAISTAGIVNQEIGKIVYANKNIPNYKGTPLKELLEEKYKVPVAVENDVNSALLGELNFGNIQTPHSALMLTIGTGVGGALYLNGEIYHGFSHSAGEVGYSIINKRNIEEVASTTALVSNVQKRVNQKDIDGKWVFNEAIYNNNEVCIEEIDQLVTNLTYLINNHISLLNPEIIILGGGIMEQSDYLKPLFKAKFEQLNKNQLVVNNTKIMFATLGNQAGILGAYSQYKKTYKE